MRIFARVKAGAKKSLVKQIGAGQFVVSTTVAPEKGRANQAVIRLLAKHLRITSSRIKLLAGATASRKVLEIV